MEARAVASFFVLGNFRGYEVVPYRVYYPRRYDAYGVRSSVVFVGNFAEFGPLLAHLHRVGLEDGRGGGEWFGRARDVSMGSRFALVGVVPITLVFDVWSSRDAFGLIRDARFVDVLKVVARGFEESVNMVDRGVADRVCRAGGWTRFTVLRMCLGEPEEVFVPVGVGGLPVVVRVPSVVVSHYCGLGVLESRGFLYLVLVPFVGAHRVGDRVVRFIERHTESAYQFFNAALRNSIQLATRHVVQDFLQRIGGVGDVVLILDTTHGINLLVSALADAVLGSLPLVKYEVLRSGRRLVGDGIFIYNTGPLARGVDYVAEGYDIPYFYTFERVRPLGSLVDDVLHLVSSGSHRVLGSGPGRDYAESIWLSMYGAVLLYFGLVLHGVHVLRISDRGGAIGVYPWVRVRVDGGDVEYEFGGVDGGVVNYGLVWFVDLLRESVRQVLASSRCLDVSRRVSRVCWDGVFGDDAFTCITPDVLRVVSRPLEELGSDDVTWFFRFVREIVNPSAKVVIDHELDEYKKDLTRRLAYFAAEPFRGAFFRAGGGGGDLVDCVTPMVVQGSIRNVVAHGGLTAVDRTTTIYIYSKRSGVREKCVDVDHKYSEGFEFVVCTAAGRDTISRLVEDLIKFLRHGHSRLP